jgi:dolichyl-phosphate-mannose-protein mannosyltransferase
MRNGTSSAVDQTGIPVYRGTHPRTSSLDDTNSSQKHDNHHHITSNSNDKDDDTNDIKGFNKKNLDLNAHTSDPAKPKRRSTPWHQSRDLQTATAITALALIVRLWAIGYPTSVV